MVITYYCSGSALYSAFTAAYRALRPSATPWSLLQLHRNHHNNNCNNCTAIMIINIWCPITTNINTQGEFLLQKSAPSRTPSLPFPFLVRENHFWKVPCVFGHGHCSKRGECKSLLVVFGHFFAHSLMRIFLLRGRGGQNSYQDILWHIFIDEPPNSNGILLFTVNGKHRAQKKCPRVPIWQRGGVKAIWAIT